MMGCARRGVVALALFRIASSDSAPRIVVRSESTAVEYFSLEAAIDDLHRARSPSSVVVEISGTHYLQKPPLVLGGLEDVMLRGVDQAVVSAGSMLDDDCWTATTDVNVWSCALPEALANVSFRTLIVGGTRANRARTPDARNDPAAPEQYFYANQTFFVRDDVWAVTLSTSMADSVDDRFTSSATIWPHSGWNNFEATLQSASNVTLDWLKLHGVSTTFSTWFEITCPVEADKNCTSYDGKLAAGARLYAYGSRSFLTDADEWARDGDTLYLYSSARPLDVAVPRATTVIAVDSSKDIAIESVAFHDTDARYLGFQSGFSVDADSIGIPTDAAVHVARSSSIRIENCVFSELGGGGVTATSTADLVVTNSTFAHLGQSGVALVGNGTTRTIGSIIANNSILGVGEVLASAGGVFCSCCTHAVISGNRIENSSRWGIAIRSNAAEGARSTNNTVIGNRLRYLGLTTKDFGGISLIAYPGASADDSMILNNRVVDVIGAWSSWIEGRPKLTSPFMSFGIYLDNEASGYAVRGNVVARTEAASIFYHNGFGNTVENNVFFGATNSNTTTGVLMLQALGNFTRANVFRRNIVVCSSKVPEGRLWNKAQFKPTALASADSNVYWASDDESFFGNRNLTALGNWSSWTSAYDSSSMIGDPLFVDAAHDDFCLSLDSPAFGLGFEALDVGVCR